MFTNLNINADLEPIDIFILRKFEGAFCYETNVLVNYLVQRPWRRLITLWYTEYLKPLHMSL